MPDCLKDARHAFLESPVPVLIPVTKRFPIARSALAALTAASAAVPGAVRAQATSSALSREIDRRAPALEAKAIAWRRDIHQHPELSNREERTSKLVADHLRSLGIEVHLMAKTGVVGVLRGGRPGPVVALRADMDALPVAEEVDVPFKSTVRSTYNGQDVGVMHACGHDAHTAILMSVAELLAGMREQLPGTVKFLFQPAEEGAPPGEEGGAALMIKEGALDNPKVDAVFGLHVFPYEVGTMHYRPGALMASSDRFEIIVHGRQTHGGLPWNGVDPVVVAAQIVLGLQTITSRQVDLIQSPAVVTVGRINAGVRYNIVPDSTVLEGTVRTFDEGMRSDIHRRLKRTAESIAASAGATATVNVYSFAPVTVNDAALTERMAGTLKRVAGADKVMIAKQTTTAEDFALYEQKVPGMFFFLGITPKGRDPATVAPNHSPRFFVDEAALVPGIRALANLAVDYLQNAKAGQP
jgi:amidohydrolase